MVSKLDRMSECKHLLRSKHCLVLVCDFHHHIPSCFGKCRCNHCTKLCHLRHSHNFEPKLDGHILSVIQWEKMLATQ